MGHVIHCRSTAKGLRFRLWSTVVDGYLTRPLTEKKMREWVLAEACRCAEEAANGDIARAATTGSSSRYDGRGLAAEWETERCQQCAGFHHAYDPRPDGVCKSCGEGKADRSHKPPCKGKR